jgi:hypothetical protein
LSTSRLSLSAYRPKPGHSGELLPHLRQEVALLRARGHITNRSAPICVTHRGEYLVITEWASASCVDEAHEDDVVLEVWRRKEQLLEYIAPSDLDNSAIPFVSYDVLEDV